MFDLLMSCSIRMKQNFHLQKVLHYRTNELLAVISKFSSLPILASIAKLGLKHISLVSNCKNSNNNLIGAPLPQMNL